MSLSARRYIHSVIAALVATSVVVSLTACGDKPEPVEPPPKPVKALTLGDASTLSKRAFPGRASAEQEADLAFRVAGKIIDRPMQVGDKVEQGQLLASLDSVDFQNQLDTVRGKLKEAEAATRNAEADYQRALNVRKADPGAISPIAVDKAEAAQSIARAARDSARSAVRIAEDRLEYTKLKAPFSGEIVAVYTEAFEEIVAKQPVARLLDRSAIEFTIDIPEHLISYTGQVESAQVRFDIRPELNIDARIKEVGRETSRGTRTYPVTLLLTPPEDFDILPGMAGNAFITANLPGSSDQNGMEIPATALFSQGDLQDSYVWVIVDNRVEKRAVTLGLPTQFGIAIKSGLKPGEQIVVAGVNTLSEGQVVKPLDVAAMESRP